MKAQTSGNEGQRVGVFQGSCLLRSIFLKWRRVEMNRVILFLIGLLMLSVLVSACGGQPSASSGTVGSRPESAPPSEKSGPEARNGGDWAPAEAEKDVKTLGSSDFTVSLEEFTAMVWERLAPRLENALIDEEFVRKELREILEELQAEGVIKQEALSKKAKETLISWLIQRFVDEGRLPAFSSQSDGEQSEEGK